jgi:hypothetical protein
MRFRSLMTFCSVLACTPSMGTTDSAESSETDMSSSSGGTTTTGPVLATTTLETTTMDPTTGPGETTESDTTEVGTTEAPIETCEDHPGVDACCCFSGEQEQVCPEEEPLCDTVELVCTTDDMAPECPEAAVEVVDEASLNCALEALSAGTPGVLRYRIDSQQNAGYWGQEWDLYVQADRTAFVRTYKYLDLSSSFEPLGRQALGSMTVFNKCLGDEPAAKIACLREATDGAISEMCVDSVDAGRP